MGSVLADVRSGCFYLAYKEVWLHAGIALILGIFTWGLGVADLLVFCLSHHRGQLSSQGLDRSG